MDQGKRVESFPLQNPKDGSRLYPRYPLYGEIEGLNRFD